MRKILILMTLCFALLFPAQAFSAPPADTCPTPVAAGDLDALVGAAGVKGYTVVSSNPTPEEFDVDIIGFENNWPYPGDKLLLARVSGAPITAAGGPAAGMSGSPIYAADGKIIGALAYGFYAGVNFDSTLIGITPAVQMTSALPPAPAVSSRSAQSLKVSVSGKSGTLKPLPNPVVVPKGSLDTPFGKKLAEQAEKRGILLAESSDSSRQSRGALSSVVQGSIAPVSGQSLTGGGKVASSVSYGRSSLSASGTVTYVCDSRFVAYGHPVFSDSSARALASQASVITPVSSVSDSWIWAVPANPVGTFTTETDYGAGGTIGSSTPTIDVVGTVENSDTGQSTTATFTQIVKAPISDYATYFTPLAAYYALSGEMTKASGLGAFDSTAETGGWTISGTSKAGPFSFTRDSAWTGYLASRLPAEDLYYDLQNILYYAEKNVGEEIQIDSIEPNISIKKGLNRFTLNRASWRPAAEKEYRSGKSTVRVKKNSKFIVRLRYKATSGKEIYRYYKMRARKSGEIQITAGTHGSSSQRFGPQKLADLLQGMKGSQKKISISSKAASLLSGNRSFDRSVSGDTSFTVEIKKPKR